MALYMKIAALLFLAQLRLAAASRTACTTPIECFGRSRLLSTIIGLNDFYTGHYTSYGCFYEGSTAYFGLGGTVESMSETDLEGGRERIWCQTDEDEADGSSIEINTQTGSPIQAPTLTPSLKPTALLLVLPVVYRPVQPTNAPTKQPIKQPTREPMNGSTSSSEGHTQTGSPIQAPSLTPSLKPTALLFDLPNETTKQPIKQPTREPTNEPTSSSEVHTQTGSPIKAPTLTPSLKPTALLFDLPVVSNEPTKQPMKQPTHKPTNEPTHQPTLLPSIPTADAIQTVCRNQEQCNSRRLELGFDRFLIGDYPAKGCYYKGNKAYYGLGGTTADIAEPNLTGDKQRIWCSIRRIPSLETTQPPMQSLISLDSIDFPVETPPPITIHSGEDFRPEFEREEVKPNLPEQKYCINIVIVTDNYGGETGFELSSHPEDESEPELLVHYPMGSLESKTTYREEVCVPKGNYKFTLHDDWGGLCCGFGKGSFSVMVDGEEVVYGGNFKPKTISYDIITGYVPEMNNVDKNWLDEHNALRKTFHEEHNKEYRPLQWSTELAKDASDWVDEILPSCKNIREPKLEEGDNMAVTRYAIGPADNESPKHIMGRWVKKVGSATMRQVMWRGTRYMGCSNKVRNNDDGSYCYVHICRYSRPGNCSVGAYPSWLAATLTDHTTCGSPCTKKGCY
mmetsp:Transcript_13091/g.27802  ORF Transcript_13091/g.27802 Transcript_13091/m.27802 type:complete len:679 (+) Transcript_13091:40-2076(+)